MMASGEIRLLPTTMRRMPVLAQSQDQGQSQDSTQIGLGLSPGQVPDPTAGMQSQDPNQLPEVTVTGNIPSDDSDASNFDPDQLPEITVTGNKGERGWQGNDPNPTKGWRPVRDANGNLTGWERRNSQTGQKERKSVQWGKQNGLDENDFSSPGDQLPAVPPLFSIPSLNPWWWLFFSAPAQ